MSLARIEETSVTSRVHDSNTSKLLSELSVLFRYRVNLLHISREKEDQECLDRKMPGELIQSIRLLVMA